MSRRKKAVCWVSLAINTQDRSQLDDGGNNNNKTEKVREQRQAKVAFLL